MEERVYLLQRDIMIGNSGGIGIRKGTRGKGESERNEIGNRQPGR